MRTPGQRYTITVQYWSDHNRTHSEHRRGDYRAALALWRKQCRDHKNAEVTLSDPRGRPMKRKSDSYPRDYGSAEPV